MPHCKLEEIPPVQDRWPAIQKFQSVKWGDMEIGLTKTPGPIDCTAMYHGTLGGGVCPCPHYGYVFEGRIRARYPGTDWPDEVAETGEVYFFPAGHVLIYEEATRALELNPAHALSICMDAMQRAYERAAAAQLETAR